MSFAPEMWNKIEIGEIVKVHWHPHELTKYPEGTHHGWACDAKQHFIKCLSGITGFYQTSGI